MAWLSSTLVMIINVITIMSMVVVGVVTYKVGMNKAADMITDRVLAALKEENALLQERVARLESVLKLIIQIFAKRNIDILIDGETVQVMDRNTATFRQPRPKKMGPLPEP